MADRSHIEWTDATWQIITGCSILSPGCVRCYAMKLAGTRLRHHPSRQGLTIETKNGPVWSGEVRFNRQWLLQPLGWKKSRNIFVCAHGDLFHENVPDEWIDEVFAVIALAPQHTFQVLTKRAERMRTYMANVEREARWKNAVGELFGNYCSLQYGHYPILGQRDPWLPLANVWLGVSTERQQEADERIPHLLGTPAAQRFISAEPLLGPIDLIGTLARFQDTPNRRCAVGLGEQLISWVIVGGESGDGARPMHPDWARGLRDQCEDAGVPFFFKQWGMFAPLSKALPVTKSVSNVAWPDGWIGAGTAVQRGGPGEALFRGTKSVTGRLLDGREHNGMPEGRR